MSFTTSATLKVMRKEDFSRVFNFVKPDEHDKEPQTEEEDKQVMNYVDTLSGEERAAWMTRHCTRLYVDFRAEEDQQKLSWSGRNSIGGWAEDIAKLVVGQFPDIDFRISTFCDSGGLDLSYGVSENGKVKWLELSDDVKDMFGWGIDVDPYTGPTPENLEELRRLRRARVQEMIDLGVNISIDQWPPTREQFEEEYCLKKAEEYHLMAEEYRLKAERLNKGLPIPVEDNDDDPDLPF